jgi:hypothetical protein
MKKIVISLLLSSICLLSHAATKEKQIPKELTIQVQKLGELLSDGYAVSYTPATYVDFINRKGSSKLVLTVFTMEGFGGGNNHTQFLAIFEENFNENNVPYYTYVDNIPIGGKGWRGVQGLKAKAIENKNGDMNISFDALEVGENDAPNFPNKKVIVKVLYSKGKLNEVGK